MTVSMTSVARPESRCRAGQTQRKNSSGSGIRIISALAALMQTWWGLIEIENHVTDAAVQTW